MALYNATDGPNWRNQNNWGTTKPISRWAGVTTNASGRVTHLRLNGTGLAGAVPVEIGDLTSLTTLNLRNNRLSGAVPVEIGDLTRLTHLNLGNNRLSGAVPVEIGDLTSLTTLNLSSNRLSGAVPVEIGDLTGLTSLYLHENGLTTLPVEIANLTHLRNLYVHSNAGLCATSDVQGWYKRISQRYPVGLDLCGEREALMALYNATGGPKWTRNTNWGTTEPLNSWYGVTTIVVRRGRVVSGGRVTSLHLNSNGLAGAVPVEIGDLTGLTHLYLHNNDLTTLPGEIANLTHLKHLHIYHNDGLCVTSDVQGWHNGVYSSNPRVLDVCPDRDALMALYYATGGPDWADDTNWGDPTKDLSEWFGVVTDAQGRVTQLSLGGNRLSGVLPARLANLTALTHLWLQGNDGLCAATPGVQVWYSGIRFRSPVSLNVCGDRDVLMALYRATGGPSWVDDTNWGDLTVPLNSWFGVVTDARGRVTQLRLDNNGLAGVLPAGLGDLTGLTHLWLGGNDGLCAATPGVQVWYRGIRNRDPGVLDVCGDRDALMVLYRATGGPSWVDDTNWGDFTTSYGSWFGVSVDVSGRVTSLHLNSNGLSGALPAEVGDLTGLTSLRLDDNDLTTLPGEFAGLTGLTRLDLSGNDGLCATTVDVLFWYGTIQNRDPVGLDVCPDRDALMALYFATGGPSWRNRGHWGDSTRSYGSWFGVVTDTSGRVTSLHLDSNRLTGALPAEIGDLTRLTTLDLHGNDLTALPAEIGDLTRLTSLRLDDNDLTVLPAELADLTSLTSLDLSGNDGLCTTPDMRVWYSTIPNRDPAGLDVCTNREALMVLFRATRGPNWTDNTNWGDSTAPLNSWFGVSTDTQGRVTSLHLNTNRLSGALPAEIGNLTSLTTLNLHGNQLTGPLPAEFGDLTRLTTLDLSSNGLVGVLPAEFGGLTRLTTLNLGDNGLVGVLPAEFGGLTRLTTLNLGDNGLVGVLPAEIGGLTSLTHLQLGDNAFSGVLPTEFGDLTNLEYLWLHNNRLTALPGEIVDLTGLTRLWLHGNAGLNGGGLCAKTPDVRVWYSTIPHRNPVSLDLCGDREALMALYNATNGPNWTVRTNWGDSTESYRGWFGVTTDTSGRVTNLNLHDNDLEGHLPAEIGDLTSLTTLNLHDNDLEVLPAEIGDLTRLTTLSLHDNDLTSVPGEIGDLTRLTTLSLHDNDLTSVPGEIGDLTRLTTLDLSGNDLMSVPGEIGDLTRLTTLNLSGNDLITVPGEIGDLTRLTQLWLKDNYLTSIPAEIGDLTRLTWLWIHDNDLTSLPAEIGDLTSLTILEAHNNDLTSLPVEIGDLTNLEQLLLDGNDLTSLPAEFGDLTNLATLDLYDNDLTGPLPAELGDLNLAHLHIYGNAPELCVTSDMQAWYNAIPFRNPVRLGTCRQLADWEVLMALYNATDGPNWTDDTNWGDTTVPLNEWYGVTTDTQGRVTHLNLHNNRLTGTLPAELRYLTLLTLLNLSSNNITGTTPTRLPTSLTHLYLHNNQLTGTLPARLRKLTGLTHLNLSHNQLTGPIPGDLTNLTNLDTLYLHGNTGLCIATDTNPDAIRTWYNTIPHRNPLTLNTCQQPHQQLLRPITNTQTPSKHPRPVHTV